MNRNQTHHRGRIAFVCIMLCLCMAGLTGRLFFLMIYKADYYSEMAEDLHQRERTIKAARGRILDRNGVVIADNRTVCTISVVHNQIEDRKRHPDTFPGNWECRRIRSEKRWKNILRVRL